MNQINRSARGTSVTSNREGIVEFEYYVYSFSTAEEHDEAKRIFEATFKRLQPSYPSRPEALPERFAFPPSEVHRGDGEVLMVCVPKERAMNKLVHERLGMPRFQFTL